MKRFEDVDCTVEVIGAGATLKEHSMYEVPPLTVHVANRNQGVIVQANHDDICLGLDASAGGIGLLFAKEGTGAAIDVRGPDGVTGANVRADILQIQEILETRYSTPLSQMRGYLTFPVQSMAGVQGIGKSPLTKALRHVEANEVVRDAVTTIHDRAFDLGIPDLRLWPSPGNFAGMAVNSGEVVAASFDRT